jgi:cytochrome P460
MSHRRDAIGILVAAGALSWCFAVRADTAAAVVPYPEGYRLWAHVKTTVIGPQAADFQRNGGIHHFYANPKAMEGYRTGAFPDGAVLVDDSMEANEKAGTITEGARHRVAVMVRDAAVYGASGGWGFEVFKGDGRDPALTAEGRAACFTCHSNAKNLVFSEYHP